MTEASQPTTSTIVVGYSSHPEGQAALARAESEAKLRDARLIVVNTGSDDEPTDVDERLAASGVSYELRGVSDPLDPAEELIGAADAGFCPVYKLRSTTVNGCQTSPRTKSTPSFTNSSSTVQIAFGRNPTPSSSSLVNALTR